MNTGHEINPNDYDKIIVAFSGGKDSIAGFLHLINMGVDMRKVELWHHVIDGREGSTLLDWPVTESYCRKFAAEFNVPLFFSWRVDGIEGEIRKENASTKGIRFESPVMLESEDWVECGCKTQVQEAGGLRSKVSTRKMMPAKGEMNKQFCTGLGKIDVMRLALNHQERFVGKKILVITCERAEESTKRAGYKVFESHTCSSGKKTVDVWRPVHGWSEKEVWAIIEQHLVNPHPCYKLGWGRCSCFGCIYSSKNAWASMAKIAPERLEKLAKVEDDIGHTINVFKGKPISLRDYYKVETPARGKRQGMKAGQPFAGTNDAEQVALSQSTEYSDSIRVTVWTLPSGAFSDDNSGAK